MTGHLKCPCYDHGMKTVTASKFKEQCLALLDQVGPEGIVITKRGRPVAKLVPYRASQAELLGSMRGQLEIDGDIIGTGIEWDAQS